MNVWVRAIGLGVWGRIQSKDGDRDYRGRSWIHGLSQSWEEVASPAEPSAAHMCARSNF